MASIESGTNKVVLKDGGTTLTLDKMAGKAVLQRKLLFWDRKPLEFPLADIEDIAVTSNKDAASGAMLDHSVLHRRSGETTVLNAQDEQEAEATVAALRSFVGLH